MFGIAQAGRSGMIIINYRNTFCKLLEDRPRNIKGPEVRLINRMIKALEIIITIFFLGIMLKEQKFLFDFSYFKYQFEIFTSYVFGGIGAFTSYLNYYNASNLGWGYYSFASLYDLLGIRENVMGIYTEYLPINIDGTIRSNIYTVIRQLLDDFGILGIIICL